VTRLGEGVDASGSLSSSAVARVSKALDGYAQAIDELAADARIASSRARCATARTRAVRRVVRERYGLEARIITGERKRSSRFLAR